MDDQANVALTLAEEAVNENVQAKVAAAMAGRVGAGAQPAAQEVPVALDEKALALKDGITNGINLRCALGQKFTSDPMGGKNAVYQAMSRSDKADFRKKWCEDGYKEHIKIIKEKVTTDSKTKSSSMTMISGRALIKREGAEAFAKYADKCMKLGPPFVEWDPMWERWNFGDVAKQYLEEFTQKKEFRVQCTADAATTKSTRQLPTAEANVEAPASGEGVVGGGKRRRLHDKQPGAPTVETPIKKVKNPPGAAPVDDKQLAVEAARLRAKAATAQGAARQIQDFMKSAPAEWEWANKTKLVNAQSVLADFLQQGTFVPAFTLTGATAAFRASYKNDPITLRNEYTNFTTKGGPLVVNLIKDTNRLLAMQAADKKASAGADA